MNAKEALLAAWADNMLGDLFLGRVHKVSLHPMAPADTPTDWHAIAAAVVLLSRQRPSLWKEVERELLRLPDGPEGTYATISLLSAFLRHRSRGENVELDIVAIAHAIRQGVLRHGPALAADQRWMGRNRPDGLLEEVRRLATKIEHEFGVIVLQAAAES